MIGLTATSLRYGDNFATEPTLRNFVTRSGEGGVALLSKPPRRRLCLLSKLPPGECCASPWTLSAPYWPSTLADQFGVAELPENRPYGTISWNLGAQLDLFPLAWSFGPRPPARGRVMGRVWANGLRSTRELDIDCTHTSSLCSRACLG